MRWHMVGSYFEDIPDHDHPFRHHLSALRNDKGRGDAGGCMPLFLLLHRLRCAALAQAGRLLRVLLVWIGAVSAGPGRARGWVYGLKSIGMGGASRMSVIVTRWLAGM